MTRFHHFKIIATIVVALAFVRAQDDYNNYGEYAEYQDFNNDYQQEDNMYYKYAEREQQKNSADKGGASGAVKLIATGVASWLLGGRYHSGRAVKDLKRKHKSEQKKLYSQYYNDVYKLGDQNNLLQEQIDELTELLKTTEKKAELEAIQRDYDEFKQPDLDSDDRISRAEFNMYVKDYLGNYPGLTEKDYPKFEEFDHDGDGYVSFEEYSQQMAIQAEQAELEELYGDGSGSSAKAQAYQDLAKGAGGNKMY
mmetsp:Transcript_17040/g.39321  ORF Transcript_17040/g.39321 Transcript_17040/m.39321 type:complete len:253 (-) Transcript_17040:999-1757(-)